MSFTFEQLRRPIGQTLRVRFPAGGSAIGTVIDSRIGLCWWSPRLELKVRYKLYQSDDSIEVWATADDCGLYQFLRFA